MLRSSLHRVLNEYQAAAAQKFTEHPLAKFIRHDIPSLLETLVVDPEIYSFAGSAGAGNWAKCPWIAVFDEGVTASAQRGFYPVYLFQENMNGVYLSLNQGVTDIKAQFGRHSRQILRSRAGNYRDQSRPIAPQFNVLSIDLQTQSPAELASFYEDGNICAAYYRADDLPDNDRLVADFLEMTLMYGRLAGHVDMPVTTAQLDDDETGLTFEDLTRIRMHKRVERNQALSRMAKRVHGYVCEACGFDFEAVYGEIGHKFIEAHHLLPVSKRVGAIVETDPKADFAVLCSNCHRMVHRLEDPGDIRSLSPANSGKD